MRSVVAATRARRESDVDDHMRVEYGQCIQLAYCALNMCMCSTCRPTRVACVCATKYAPSYGTRCMYVCVCMYVRMYVCTYVFCVYQQHSAHYHSLLR